jgi:hypothetical protein
MVVSTMLPSSSREGTALAMFKAGSIMFRLRFQAVQSGSLNLFMGWARRRWWFTHVQPHEVERQSTA